FSLIGGIILGIAPATKTLVHFLIEDEQNSEVTNKKLFKKFFEYYKHKFWRTNRLFAPVLVLVVILFLDLSLLEIYNFTTLDSMIFVSLKIFTFAFTTFLFNLFWFSEQEDSIK